VAPEAQRKLAAILSADVVGYSRLMAEDESATIRTLTDYREAISMLVRQHRGRVVDSPGDNLLAEFPTALDAVQAAVEIQRVIGARNADLPGERRMNFRIGVHLGDISLEGERLYGEGVNIAARLEGLAESGGVCISGTVQEQVRHKLEVGYEDLGEQSVKNIPEPIRAYQVREPRVGPPPVEHPARGRPVLLVGILVLGGLVGVLLWRLSTPSVTPTDEQLTVPGFGGAPAIAVLPFDNLSGDPEQEYFADGIVEDLITRMSAVRDFPVISRNSSFIYKGRSVDVKQVSRELGVRYVIEGSVRKAGDRVRINAQLIDATTGAHIWAKTYDRELKDLFAVQDEIVEAIFSSAGLEWIAAERERAVRKEPDNLDAWEFFQRASWHYLRHTKDDSVTARSLLQQAIALDPHFAPAFVGLAYGHQEDVIRKWSASPGHSIAEMERAARQAIEADPNYPWAHSASGAAYRITGQWDKAIAAFERAIQLNPSFSNAYFQLAICLAVTGRPDEALAKMDKAIRLSPQNPLMNQYHWAIALAHSAARRYEEAVEWGEKSRRLTSDDPVVYPTLVMSYAHLGRLEEARSLKDAWLRLQPQASLASVRSRMPNLDPELVERTIDGLRRAGLPEG
jgi:adenylate cyclase